MVDRDVLSTETKVQLWVALREHLEAELDSMTRSQKKAHAGATHEEAKPENSKDTRALEQTYLARGLAGRVADLREGLAILDAFNVKSFSEDEPIAITALVALEREDGGEMIVLIAPTGGGVRLQLKATQARVVTPDSPLGRALLGKRRGDDAEIRGPGGVRELAIVNVF